MHLESVRHTGEVYVVKYREPESGIVVSVRSADRNLPQTITLEDLLHDFGR